jgi:hypothetical protein
MFVHNKIRGGMKTPFFSCSLASPFTLPPNSPNQQHSSIHPSARWLVMVPPFTGLGILASRLSTNATTYVPRFRPGPLQLRIKILYCPLHSLRLWVWGQQQILYGVDFAHCVSKEGVIRHLGG